MLKVDLHTHSIASGHAINTVYELARAAKNKGMTILGIVEHGPAIQGAPHEGYFWISDQIDKLYGVKLLLGIEANILNQTGIIDLSDELLKKQKVVMAGIHAKTPYESCARDNTQAIINAMKNPLIQIISHPYRLDFPVNIEKIVETAYKTNTLLELNNQVFAKESQNHKFLESYKRVVTLSKHYNHPLIIGSDAHIATKIGEDTAIMRVSEDIGLTKDIIINNKPNELLRWMKS